MKRVKLTLLAKDKFSKPDAEKFAADGGGELEAYEEKALPKDGNVVTEHSFDTLLEGAFEFAQGIWLALKGFGKLMLWTFIVIFAGLKWLWSEGVGKKKEKKKG